MNGDADADLLVDEGGTLGYYPSTGDGIGSLVTTDITGVTATDTALPMNVKGDGLPDLGISDGNSLTYYPHGQVSSDPDLLNSITDGDGNTIQPSYVSITAGAYTLGTNATDPESDWVGDLWVTDSLSLPNGIGGTYDKTYTYADARWNRLRGFEGFGGIDVTNHRTGIYSQTTLDQLYPLTGMATERDVFQSDGTPISKTTYAVTDKVLDSSQYDERYFPYASKVTTDRYQVGGTENGAEITQTETSNTPDDFGNFTGIDTTVTDEYPGSPFNGDAWETDATAQYADDTTTWCLSLPTSLSVKKIAPGEPAITRATTFTPDDTKCRENSETEDAGNSSFDVTRAFSYDSFGNVSQVTVTGSGMAARTRTYGWGTTGQFPETIQDPVGYADGYQERIGYDYGLGLKSSAVVQSTGGTDDAPATTWTYGPFGRVKKETRPDGSSLNLTYAACSSNCLTNQFETVTETTEGTGGAEITDQSTDLDHFGRPLAVLKRLMDGSYSEVERQYDALGNVAKQSAPCAASNCTAYWTQMSYDLLNRPTQVARPDPESTGTLDTTHIAYTGLTTTVTGPKGEVRTKVADVTGAVRETRDPTGYGQDFTYDSDGNLLNVQDTQGATIVTDTYDYGGAGDYLASRYDRALGTWTYSPDALGDVTSYTDEKGQVFHLSYDGLGRPVERDDGWTSTGSETVTTWVWGHTPADHDVGSLDSASATTAVGTYTAQNTYDADGRLSDRAITIPGDTTYHYDFGYDPTTGLLSSLQYPVSGGSYRLTLAYCYEYGILTAVADGSCSGGAFWQANTENAMSEITEDTLGNGIVTERTFLPVTGWLAKAISGTSAGSAGVQNQSYLYDPLGDVIQRQDNNQGLTENFQYDSDNRLLYSTLQDGSTTTTNLQMSYNPDGSISQKIETGGTDAPVPYSVSWTSYNYPKTISATVNINGSSVNESTAFDYGPNRQRWRMVYTKGSASETTEYVGGLMEKVSSSAGTGYRYYIYGTDGLAAIQAVDSTGGTNTHYVLSDQEGSISSLLNSDGSTDVNESFTAFGNRRSASSWSGFPSSAAESNMDSVTRQGFTGHTVLGQMGLNHMNGRVEDAVSGTFLSPDPFIDNAMNTQDYNRYTYVDDNPVTRTDPTGFDTLKSPDNGTGLGGGWWVTVYDAPSDCSYSCAAGGSPDGGSGQNPTTQPQQSSPGNTTATLQGNQPPTAFQTIVVTPPQESTSWGTSSWSLFGASDTAPVIGTASPSARPRQSNTENTTSTPQGNQPIAEVTITATTGTSIGYDTNFMSMDFNAALAESLPQLFGQFASWAEQSLLARLMFAESAGVASAYSAVGWSIVNRVGTPGFPGTLSSVIYEPGQFASVGQPLWNAAGDPTQLAGLNAVSYAQALGVAGGILNGTIPDPTGGAEYFYSGGTPSGWFQNNLNSGTLTPTYSVGPFTFLVQH